MFFENSHFYNFVEKCRNVGIDKPIIAGLLPALSLKQVMNFKDMCSTEIPEKLVEKLANAPEADGSKIGLEWAQAQIEDLMNRKIAKGIHLYILNRAESALTLSHLIREK